MQCAERNSATRTRGTLFLCLSVRHIRRLAMFERVVKLFSSYYEYLYLRTRTGQTELL